MEFFIKLLAVFVITVVAVLIGLKVGNEANAKDWPIFRNYDGLTG